MKVVKDYTDFEKKGGGKYADFTISLTATYDNKETADAVAKILEELKNQLENLMKGKTDIITLRIDAKFRTT
jgi:hypothetical protein